MSPNIATDKKRLLLSQRGFALITAILACAILFALAMLVITLSTGDLRVSGRTVGSKKAMTAAETGVHRAIQDFNPENIGASAVTGATADAHSLYTISTPTGRPPFGINILEVTGAEMSWVRKAYYVNIEGRNETYNTKVNIGLGFGYGPVNRSPGYDGGVGG